jgi:hypothetical protein
MTRGIGIWAVLAVSWVAPSELAAAPALLALPSPLERGQEVAKAVATVTGTAISPLFGVCILGAFTYVKTSPEMRAALPFYCAPAFWIPLAVLVAMVFFKDTLGAFLPLLKKPLDAIEILVINKAALVFAVLPVVWHEAAAVSGPPGAHGILSAAASGIPMGPAVIVGAVIAVSVWLTGHALDILALLSPIPLLDACLKATRAAMFLALGVLAALDTRAALLVSLGIIAICFLCFWWAYQLALFGSVFAWDILRARLLGRRRNPALDGEVLGFTAYAIGGLRKRSFGALRIAGDGSLEFVHRPAGIGFRSAIRLQRPDVYEVGRGFFFPCVLAPETGGNAYRFQFRLLPRYTGFEEQISDVLRLGGVRDLRIPAELRSAWNWMHGTIARSR